jgi:hypothetical protein
MKSVNDDRGDNNSDCAVGRAALAYLITFSMMAKKLPVHAGCLLLRLITPLPIGNTVRFGTALLYPSKMIVVQAIAARQHITDHRTLTPKN